jgi:asparagine synthetase B (glutamine-hydrolysing)
MDALKSRLKSRPAPAALLSGGLDSRAIVAGLKELGADVTALNCAIPGSQDYEYAHRFARAIGVPLRNVPWSADLLGTTPGSTTAGLLSFATQMASPGVVFSGDGGGETLGFLIMTEPVMDLLRQGRVQEGIAAYVKDPPVPKYLFQPEVFSAIATAPSAAMEREMRNLGQVPPEKAMQLFLLTNDLRCHLHDFFDRTLEHRVELLLPFYDRRVLESVIRIPAPLDSYLGHRLYHDWLQRFPAVVTSVPWQAYSTHLPCPVPDPNPPIPQNTVYKQHVPRAARRWMKMAVRSALRPDFPSSVMSRTKLFIAAALHGASLRDYTYVFKTCLNVNELLSKSKDSALPTAKHQPSASAKVAHSK